MHNLANRVVIPVLHRCRICLEPESEHNDGRHDFELDSSLPRWHGWYSLRRGVATVVNSISKDSYAAKGLLRHSSVSTTQRHYIKDVPANTLEAMKLLEIIVQRVCNG
jgi:hypothetical protein